MLHHLGDFVIGYESADKVTTLRADLLAARDALGIDPTKPNPFSM